MVIIERDNHLLSDSSVGSSMRNNFHIVCRLRKRFARKLVIPLIYSFISIYFNRVFNENLLSVKSILDGTVRIGDIRLVDVERPVHETVVIIVDRAIFFKSLLPMPIIFCSTAFLVISLIQISVIHILILIAGVSDRSKFYAIRNMVLVVRIRQMDNQKLCRRRIGLSVLIVRCRRFLNLSSDLTRNILVVSQVFNLDC